MSIQEAYVGERFLIFEQKSRIVTVFECKIDSFFLLTICV